MVRARRHGRKVELDVVVASDELLHLGAIVQLHQGSNAPHDAEDVDLLQVVRGKPLVLVLLGGDQAFQQVDGLHRTSSLD